MGTDSLTLFQQIMDLYSRIVQEIREAGENKIDDYFVTKSPLIPIGILLVYYLFVTKIGKGIMKSRKAYELKVPILIYNFLQILANVYMFYRCVMVAKERNINCTIVERKTNEVKLLFYYYHLLKMSDFIETIFFVLRKKFNQISTLHVYHHIMMAFLSWAYLVYFPGGPTIYLGTANTFVHSLMYCYYFLTAYNESYKKNVWWKKYITAVQIVQHVFITYAYLAPFIAENCDFSRVVSYTALPNCFLMIWMFAQFYYRNYIATTSREKAGKKR